MRIELLGGIVLDGGGPRTDVGTALGAHGRLLLGRLLTEQAHRVSREDLADTFWPEDLPGSWDAMLRNAATRLRGVLIEAGLTRESLTSDGGAYVLRLPDDAEVDLAEALAAADAAEAHSAKGAHAAAAADAERAATLLAGRFLPAATGVWVEERQVVLTARRARALEVLAAAALALGEHERARRAAEDVLVVEPFRESAHRILMEAYEAAGNRAEAIRAYSALRVLLDTELGTYPSPESEALFLRLLGESPASGPDPVAGPVPTASFPSSLHDAAPSHFIGRAVEWEAARRAWVLARGGELQLVLISGHPGIGKSALAAAVARAAHDDGALVLHGRVREDLDVPYSAVVEALHQLADSPAARSLAERDAQRAGILGRLIPELAPADDSGSADRALPDAAAERLQLFEAVAWWLRAAAAGNGLVLALDDLHWADAATLQLLRHIAFSASGGRVLVLATHRSGEHDAGALRDVLPDLRRPGRTVRVDLRGMAEDEVGELIADAAGRGPTSLVHALWSDTGGNPFHVRELVRDLIERGILTSGEHELTAASPLKGLLVPESVRAVLRRRLARQSAAALEVLGVAAVCGAEFDLQVVGSVADADAPAAIAEAERAGVLEPLREVPGRFRFAHALLRRALYDDLDAVTRMRRHRAVGEALEGLETPGDRVDALAHHFLEAAPLGDARRAVGYARWAGDAALAALDLDGAAALYGRALRALEIQPDTGERVDLLTALGDAQRRLGDPGHRAVLFSAAALARDLGDPVRLARAALVLVRRGVAQRAGRADEELIALVDEAVAGLGDGEEATLLRARLLSGLAAAVMYTPAEHRRPELGRSVRELVPRLSEPADVLAVMVNDYYASFDPDTFAERFARHDAVMALAERLGDAEATGLVSLYRHADLLERGDVEAAAGSLVEAEDVAARLPQASWLAWRVAAHRAGHAALTADVAEAEALAEVALEVGRLRGVPMSRVEVTHLFHLLAVRERQGRAAELEPAVLRFAESHPGFPILRVHACLLAEANGRGTEARNRLTACLAGIDALPRNTYWCGTMMLLAEAVTRIGDAAEGADLARRLDPYAGRGSWTGSVSHGPVAARLALLAQVA